MAGNSNAIRAGGAYYELFAVDSPLKKGLKKAETMVKSSVAGTAARVVALGAAATAAIAGAVAAVVAPTAALKAFAEVGSELTDVARRTGASAAALSTLGYAAKQTGSDLQGVAGLITTLRDKTIAAARGSEEAQLAFARLGIDFLALSRMKPQDQLRLVADRLKQIPNAAVKAAMATELLGSADMLPTLDRLAEMETRAKRLGLVLSNEDAAAAKDFDMALTDLWESLKFLGVELGAKIAPTLQQWVETSTSIVGKAREWISANGDLMASAEKLWEGFKAQWTAGTQVLSDLWDAMTVGIKHAWIDASATVKTAWSETLDFIGAKGESTSKKVEESTAHMVSSWGEYFSNLKGAAGSVAKVWTDTIGTIEKRWRDLMQLFDVDFTHPGTKKKTADEAELRKNLPADKNSILEQGGIVALSPHKRRLKEIEDERKAGHAALNQQVQAANAARADAAAAGARNVDIDLDVGNKKNGVDLKGAESITRQRGGQRRGGGLGASAQAGFATALMQVKGIGGEDVRTSSGFRGILQSLRQQQTQNPLVTLAQQQLNLDQQQARDVRQLRINSDKTTVRN